MSGTRRKPGRMGPFVSGFQTSLSEQGYSALAVRNMLKDVGAVGRWMQERDLQPSQLTLGVIAEFRSACLAVGRRKVPSVKSFEPLLRFLRAQGVIGEPPSLSRRWSGCWSTTADGLLRSGAWRNRRSFGMRISPADSFNCTGSTTVSRSRR